MLGNNIQCNVISMVQSSVYTAMNETRQIAGNLVAKLGVDHLVYGKEHHQKHKVHPGKQAE
jgi:hypothetical protein